MAFREPKAHEFLTVCVYENHRDYPDRVIAIGFYFNRKTKEIVAGKEIMECATYGPIERALKERGMVRCGRLEDDDPTIMENWV